ncbi:uncharacterized protein LOC109520455 isoform X2 [Hippocampus comes]|uniref:uncharacterized protein LOC109520455 isoform X2 n=1 Tax=Hippocampus comes TaxID=109280 RepID=UPI00094F1F5C|nr:PREDICTED: uncharacterized protein LOC109520455 isoform X2 [Hippocampus comes]
MTWKVRDYFFWRLIRLIFELVAANDTALQLAFRMQDKKILLTADLNGTKNIEEKEMDSFLFGPGRDFEVIIQCHDGAHQGRELG